MATSLVNTIQTYLQRKHSPLAPYANLFVRYGNQYGVDPRFLVAITGAETSFGTAGSGLANPTGYASATRFGLNRALQLQARALGIQHDQGDFRAHYAGKFTIPQIAATWAPVGASNDPNGTNGEWPRNVSQFYRELGGNPSGRVTGYRPGSFAAGLPTATTTGAQTTPGQTAPAATTGATLPTASVTGKPFDFNAMMRLVNADMPRIMAGQAPNNIWKILALAQNQRAPVVTMTPGSPGTPTTTAPTTTPAPASGRAGGAINAAMAELGVPYSWGGGGPGGPSTGTGRGANTRGFDCSSLVQYAYAKIGVKLPRTTYEQIHVGRAISPSNQAQWRPGDLLFPHEGHVQMYLGNGKVIEAPRTGGVVQVTGLRGHYIAVRRPV